MPRADNDNTRMDRFSGTVIQIKRGGLMYLAGIPPQLNSHTNLGVAGLMGTMWLWERRTSQKRETQIDEAYARIMGGRVQLDQLMAVVRQNAEAVTRMSSVQDQLLRELTRSERSAT